MRKSKIDFQAMQIYKANDVLCANEGILVKKEKANRNKNPHRHEFIELVFIRHGEGIESVDGVDYEVKYGDLLFINFGSSHAFSISDMEFVHILLRPEFVSDALVNSENIFDVFALPQFSTIKGDIKRDCIVSFDGDELLRITAIIDAMLFEYKEKKQGYLTLLHGYTQVLFAMLIRRLKELDSGRRTAVDKISQYVDSHLGERVTLTGIAKSCFYNPSYFSRKFKTVFGKNLGEYIKEKRILKASELLKTSELPIEAIISTVGFSDKSYFYKLFRERYGITPSEYRKGKKQTH